MADSRSLLLEVEHLCKWFPLKRTAGDVLQRKEKRYLKAVNDVSFQLFKGENLGLVGESGCGKSVTIQTIMKLLPSPPSRIKSGSITYQGADITHLSDKAMESYRGKEFSMIFQDSMTSLNPTMRVGRQMCEGILRHQKVSRQEAQRISVELLGQVGMGILMKAIPQINVFSINIELKVLIGLVLLLLLISPFSEFLLQTEITMLDSLRELLAMTG